MTLRRRRLLSLVLLAAVALVGGWLLWPRSAINEANFAKIRRGMTLAEVEAILGGPARMETTGPIAAADPDPTHAWDSEVVELFRISYDHSPRETPPRLPLHTQLWESDYLVIRVEFDADGQAIAFNSLPVRRIHESLWEKLRRWLRL